MLILTGEWAAVFERLLVQAFFAEEEVPLCCSLS